MQIFNKLSVVLCASLLIVGCNANSSNSNSTNSGSNLGASNVSSGSGQLLVTASCDRNNVNATCTAESTAVFVTVQNNGLPPSPPITITLSTDNQSIIYTDNSESSCNVSTVTPVCVFEFFSGTAGTATVTATSSNSNYSESSATVVVGR